METNRFFAMKSDWIRLVLLYKYGGLYFDLDILFLKPPETIIYKYKEFVCPWGSGALMHTNNNMMYFSRENIIKLSEAAVRERKAACFFGLSFLTYENLAKHHIHVLSLCEIDACWGCENISCSSHFIFQNISNKIKTVIDFLNSQSFGYHWHNGYHEKIEEGSYFNLLERTYNAKFNLPQIMQ